jgi:hypothetical protein
MLESLSGAVDALRGSTSMPWSVMRRTDAPRPAYDPPEPAWKGFDAFKDAIHPRQPTWKGCAEAAGASATRTQTTQPTQPTAVLDCFAFGSHDGRGRCLLLHFAISPTTIRFGGLTITILSISLTNL